MVIKRLRPLPSPERLAELYATPHDHRLYGRGHGERVDATIELARRFNQSKRVFAGRPRADSACVAASMASA